MSPDPSVEVLDTHVGVTHAITNGCGAAELQAVLEALSEHMAAAHGIAVGVVPLFVTKPPSRGVRLEVLKALSTMPDVAVVTAICRPDPHWTVVRQVMARHLLTFDSSGHGKLKHTALARRSECTTNAPWAAAFMLTLRGS